MGTADDPVRLSSDSEDDDVAYISGENIVMDLTKETFDILDDASAQYTAISAALESYQKNGKKKENHSIVFLGQNGIGKR